MRPFLEFESEMRLIINTKWNDNCEKLILKTKYAKAPTADDT